MKGASTLPVSVCIACAVPATALAWGGEGHVMVTYLALDGAQGGLPAFVAEQDFRDHVAYMSNEPDRRRAIDTLQMSHENDPEHYLDAEWLALYDLSLDTLPPFRYEFITAIALARANHPDRFDPIDPQRDRAKIRAWPGFAPYAVMEQYVYLQNAFRMVRILEIVSVDDPLRLVELDQARANCAHHMGIMSHWVGDLAQPLHTTKHHHGWVGENPRAYTTDRKFHAYIDSGVIDDHAITCEVILANLGAPAPDRANLDSAAVWPGVLSHVGRSFVLVEPLYEIEKSGDLKKDVGRAFIESRLHDGATTLAALWLAAWETSALDEKDLENYLNYEPASPTQLQAEAGAGAGAAEEGKAKEKTRGR